MKLVIISDTHDNLPNFRKAVEWAGGNGFKSLIHCGDVCSINTWDKALKGFKGRCFLGLGNADKGYAWEQRSAGDVLFREKVFTGAGSCELGKTKIAFCHFPEQARTLAESGRYNLVFYGHAHKPWIQRIGQCELVNPGNLAGLGCKPTFAVYDTESARLDLKILYRLR